jgi:biopolymer transport protein ExbB
MKKLLTLLLLTVLPLSAQAWWNDSWTARRAIVIDTAAETGVAIDGAVATLTVPVRLHSGNFDFLGAKLDGSDLRLMAADDLTPLNFHIERYDATEELGLLWVQLPQVAPQMADQKVYAYFGNVGAPPAQNAAASFDAATGAVLHFGEADGVARDASANGNTALGPVGMERAGLLGASARFDGTQALELAPSVSLSMDDARGTSIALWVRPDASSTGGTLYRQGEVRLEIDKGTLMLRTPTAEAVGGSITPDQWQHVVVTARGGEVRFYLDGQPAAAGTLALPLQQAPVLLGEGFAGLMDEVHIATTVRSPAWVKLSAAAQGAGERLLRVTEDMGEAVEAGSHSYFGILVANLTTDAWVVIVILLVMFVIALLVMVAKAQMVARIDSHNRAFLQRFREAGHGFLALGGDGGHGHSSLYRLYQAGVRELGKRTDAGQTQISAASIDAIKAAVDADLVRESHKLNAKMVMLTIAISGGPFLGLLGTVVGVMITFAAIAAAGDVNVNAIAPGIAAALLATVAGLAVAIPALFGYNYLASRIKNISADMQIFVDEFITRIAEVYAS